ncbi:aminoglycoside phosphotransferase family protein [Paenibacillus sp. JX-17]|uniref:Aminoglycoside phosphotransferase family protein n=1 Tax=Paenibacillus lacisoli TaxID=3064525 RepID=A0ABT9CEA6_9BACL|nr:aminoglycoside phosphotransferase family protein [Paenibacillus sp. JX-17]MDO7907609.1 aminoglycoside phosphotransferase family protein [Paenibacillus sp. JX-17]
MGNLLQDIDWKDKTRDCDRLLESSLLKTEPIAPGFEAEVVRVHSGQDSLVLKIWNRQSRPDVGFQYRLLSVLYEQGIAVSRPLGWGKDAEGHFVLLTSYDGEPLMQLDDSVIAGLAVQLARIHETDVIEGGKIELPLYSFKGYFYPQIEQFPDLEEPLNQLLPLVSLQQTAVIHGDYHLGNIVGQAGRHTIIDWTNAQWGDARYDFAWSHLLMELYVPQPYASLFETAYLLEHPIGLEVRQQFQALACIRWLLLYRHGHTPKADQLQQLLDQVVQRNPVLASLGMPWTL